MVLGNNKKNSFENNNANRNLRQNEEVKLQEQLQDNDGLFDPRDFEDGVLSMEQ